MLTNGEVEMPYLELALLFAVLVGIGIFNYRSSCRTARKLIDQLRND
jgi:hypothetical protein